MRKILKRVVRSKTLVYLVFPDYKKSASVVRVMYYKCKNTKRFLFILSKVVNGVDKRLGFVVSS